MNTQLYADGRLELHTEREHTERNVYVFSADDVATLRALLSVPPPTPGLTTEEAEVARIEAELEQARTDELISGHNRFAPNKGVFDSWCYVLMLKKQPSVEGKGSTLLEAARAALAHVRKLRAEADAKKLPEPEDMTAEDKLMELVGRGYVVKMAGLTNSISASVPGEPLKTFCFGKVTSLSDILHRARKLDGV